jgi:uncharacterized membrane protein
MKPRQDKPDRRGAGGRTGPVIAACTLLGFGMGGFLDGIVLHQILQWHQMISNILPPATLAAKSVNMFWDGIFHAFTWIMTAIGLVMVWRLLFRKDIAPTHALLAGSLLFGWGIFNAMDSIANHYILGLHNVKENAADPRLWNHGFFLLSLLQIAAGWLWIGGYPAEDVPEQNPEAGPPPGRPVRSGRHPGPYPGWHARSGTVPGSGA